MKKEKIYLDIKNKIVSEELNSGQWLVERELCAKYQTSRTPIREILQRLVAEGLLDVRKSKGYVVKTLSMREIVEIFQTREAVECMLTRLACQNLNDDSTAILQRLRERLEEVEIEEDPSAGVLIGKKLHDLISETAKNSLLYDYYLRIKDLSALTRNITKRSTEIENRSKDEHLKILEAMLNGDAASSEACMKSHLQNTCERIVETYFSELKKSLNYVQT